MEAVNAAKGVLQGRNLRSKISVSLLSVGFFWLLAIGCCDAAGVKKRPISELELSTARRTRFF